MSVKPILFVIALLLSSGVAHSQVTDLPATSTTTVEYSFGGGEIGTNINLPQGAKFIPITNETLYPKTLR